MGPPVKEFRETARESLSRPDALDRMLDEVDDEDKKSEDDSLVQGGINQGFIRSVFQQARVKA